MCIINICMKVIYQAQHLGSVYLRWRPPGQDVVVGGVSTFSGAINRSTYSTQLSSFALHTAFHCRSFDVVCYTKGRTIVRGVYDRPGFSPDEQPCITSTGLEEEAVGRRIFAKKRGSVRDKQAVGYTAYGPGKHFNRTSHALSIQLERTRPHSSRLALLFLV